MHEALCRPSSTTLDPCMPRDGPPITQRTSGLVSNLSADRWLALQAVAVTSKRVEANNDKCDCTETDQERVARQHFPRRETAQALAISIGHITCITVGNATNRNARSFNIGLRNAPQSVPGSIRQLPCNTKQKTQIRMAATPETLMPAVPESGANRGHSNPSSSLAGCSNANPAHTLRASDRPRAPS
jgi:hypothetical protein